MTYIKNHPHKFIPHIQTPRKSTTLLRHAAYSPFNSPQIAIYFIISSISIQTILTFSINLAEKFKYQLCNLRITTDTSKHKGFHYYNMSLMQGMQYSTFTVECILISALTLPVEVNSTALYQSKQWTFCSIQFEDIHNSRRLSKEFIIQNTLMHKFLIEILHDLS